MVAWRALHQHQLELLTEVVTSIQELARNTPYPAAAGNGSAAADAGGSDSAQRSPNKSGGDSTDDVHRSRRSLRSGKHSVAKTTRSRASAPTQVGRTWRSGSKHNSPRTSRSRSPRGDERDGDDVSVTPGRHATVQSHPTSISPSLLARLSTELLTERACEPLLGGCCRCFPRVSHHHLCPSVSARLTCTVCLCAVGAGNRVLSLTKKCDRLSQQLDDTKGKLAITQQQLKDALKSAELRAMATAKGRGGGEGPGDGYLALENGEGPEAGGSLDLVPGDLGHNGVQSSVHSALRARGRYSVTVGGTALIADKSRRSKRKGKGRSKDGDSAQSVPSEVVEMMRKLRLANKHMEEALLASEEEVGCDVAWQWVAWSRRQLVGWAEVAHRSVCAHTHTHLS